MKDATPQAIYRCDYQAPTHWIDHTTLSFDLNEEGTLVRSRLKLRRNEAYEDAQALRLDGENLKLVEILLDGQALDATAYTQTSEYLEIAETPEAFELELLVEIYPQNNTRLEGLYKAANGKMFCTQCEAQGFRHITYYLDRPDVMSRFTVSIEADASRYPVLLSNGNRISSEDLGNGRQRVQWEDPFLKPSYLFALVAGDLLCHRGSFNTQSKREVALEIWVEEQNIDKCEHALISLQKAMRWDEEVFGLEYDLDLYMIVATNDFNMGAMENKGLNVFNSKFVLSLPETATDEDYGHIEGVIGHEYFHNWTGNRVTCRDWFQLTLKEGLTVFRDQQFSADMGGSPAVKRIDDVKILRASQFAEDSGPMAHPIRPESYIEMNNFYTVTVYNKGAEVIRLYHTLLGAEGFRKGMDLYFQRHDGQAVTCNDFRMAMADANGVDLTQFERWYSQSGTPVIKVSEAYDEDEQTYTLTLIQSGPSQEGDKEFEPMLIPVRLGLLDTQGNDMHLTLDGEHEKGPTTRVLEFKRTQQSFRFVNMPERPLPSLLRGFSAPVKLVMDWDMEDLAFLMAHDSDDFNRWDAAQTLATRLILDLASSWRAGAELSLPAVFSEAFAKVLADTSISGDFKSLLLQLPEEKLLAQSMDEIDVEALHAARNFLQRGLAQQFKAELLKLYAEQKIEHEYRPEREDISKRRLMNACLEYLACAGEAEGLELAAKQFAEADNMTNAQAALKALANIPGEAREQALASFHARWQHEPLVLDKWFQLQAESQAEDVLERIGELRSHADFTLKNPNRVRSLIGSLSLRNFTYFHHASGQGYRLLADTVIELDPLNPQTASRLVSGFNLWKRFDAARQGLMCEQLKRIMAQPGLSSDVFEIVSRSLNQ